LVVSKDIQREVPEDSFVDPKSTNRGEDKLEEPKPERDLNHIEQAKKLVDKKTEEEKKKKEEVQDDDYNSPFEDLPESPKQKKELAANPDERNIEHIESAQKLSQH
jgi:hypothetical protein